MGEGVNMKKNLLVVTFLVVGLLVGFGFGVSVQLLGDKDIGMATPVTPGLGAGAIGVPSPAGPLVGKAVVVRWDEPVTTIPSANPISIERGVEFFPAGEPPCEFYK